MSKTCVSCKSSFVDGMVSKTTGMCSVCEKETHGNPLVSQCTLRDWFAGMALQGLISIDGISDVDTDYCYRKADEMLKSREADL